MCIGLLSQRKVPLKHIAIVVLLGFRKALARFQQAACVALFSASGSDVMAWGIIVSPTR